MKKKGFCLSALLLGAMMLTSCSQTNNKVSFSNYWYKNADIPSEQTEKLEYAVSFEEGIGLDGKYDLSYTDGKYTTTFGLVKYGEGESERSVYYLKSELTIKVEYTLNGASSEVFEDSVLSEVWFEKTTALTPIKSHKEIINHTPLSVTPEKVSDCYSLVDYTVDVVYDGDEGKAVLVNRANENRKQTQEFEFDDSDRYNYLDNEQLLFSLRAVNPAEKATPNFLVYAPFSSAVQTVQASFGDKESGKKFAFKKDGVDFNESVDYRSVSLSLAQDNPGVTQTLKIATTNDSKANVFRNVILEMTTPLSFGFGKLTYKLTSAEFFN